MNHHDKRRAHAGSSRALGEHGGVIEAGIILNLSGNVNKSFSKLLDEMAPISQSVLAAACATLLSDGWLTRIENGNFILTSRALDMISAAQFRKRGEARRRAA
jgi:DNA-binding HxlR family transcriptional regulator